jgi:hypothetical protein
MAFLDPNVPFHNHPKQGQILGLRDKNFQDRAVYGGVGAVQLRPQPGDLWAASTMHEGQRAQAAGRHRGIVLPAGSKSRNGASNPNPLNPHPDRPQRAPLHGDHADLHGPQRLATRLAPAHNPAGQQLIHLPGKQPHPGPLLQIDRFDSDPFGAGLPCVQGRAGVQLL